MVPFCDNHGADIKAESFGHIGYSELTFVPDLFIFMSAALSTWSRSRRETERKFVENETTTTNTPTKAIDQFAQMVIALEVAAPPRRKHQRVSPFR